MGGALFSKAVNPEIFETQWLAEKGFLGNNDMRFAHRGLMRTSRRITRKEVKGTSISPFPGSKPRPGMLQRT